MNLKERRAQWESKLEVVCEMNQQGHSDTLLVVLKAAVKHTKFKNIYHCHRYLGIAVGDVVKAHEEWECSIDARWVDADTAMKWLADPTLLLAML